jgi:hypothetical protein
MKQSVLIAALLFTIAGTSFAQAPAATKPAASASSAAGDSASAPAQGKKHMKGEKHHNKKADAPAHAASAASATK